jgi:hypothetical protein
VSALKVSRFRTALFGGGRFARVFLFELLHAPAGIDELLFAGVKRVALGAHFKVQVVPGGTGGKFIAAGALNLNFFVRRMDAFFHG